jgi:hypothetical protein
VKRNRRSFTFKFLKISYGAVSIGLRLTDEKR